MKIIYKISLVALVSAVLFSCSKSKVTPAKLPHVDTSTTLISDTRLVGNWAIVTDTIAINNNGNIYKGTTGDYYKFTKYGNLYVAESQLKLVDTAIYTITSASNQVSWTNLFTSVNGTFTNQVTTAGPFTIVNVDATNLVLMQSVNNSGGSQYEKITLKKMN